MINWRSGKAGFVGASKRLVLGMLNFTHQVAASLLPSGSVTCTLEVVNEVKTIEFDSSLVTIDMDIPTIPALRIIDQCDPDTLKGILMKWTYDNNFDSFSLLLGEYIVSRSILLADITEATFMVKLNEADADVDAKAVLTISDGLTLVAGATEEDATIEASFRATDFGATKMEVGARYYMGLGIKTAIMTKFLEVKPVDNRLILERDFIHD